MTEATIPSSVPSSVDYHEAATVFIAEVLPELEDAAPVLVDRYLRGEPLTGSEAPSGLGFNIGVLDPEVVECFRHLMEALKFAVVHLGLLSLVQNWWFGRGRAKREQAIVRGVQEVMANEAAVKDCVATMVRAVVALEKSRGNAVTDASVESEITNALAAGIERNIVAPPEAANSVRPNDTV